MYKSILLLFKLLICLVFFTIANLGLTNAQVVAFDDFLTVPEDSFIVISPSGNDIIIEPFVLQKNGNFPGNNNIQTINNSTQFLYTPDPSFSGFDTIGYRICTTNILPECDIAIIVVQVLPRPDTPVARPDTIYMFEDTDTLISVLKNDYDLDGDPMFIVVSVGPKHAQTVNNVNFQKIYYKPTANYNGLDSLFYTACDDQNFGTSGLCSKLTLVYIIVIPVNDKSIANDDRDTLLEDQTKCISVLLNDTDVDLPNDKLIVSGIAKNAMHGSVIFTNSQVCYTPVANYFGKDTIQYIVCDTVIPSKCDTAFIFLVINPVNDKPIAIDDNYIINEDIDSCFLVLLNDSDVEGIINITAIISGPSKGIANIVSNKICYFPNDNFNGRDTLLYVITDNSGAKDTAEVIIQLIAVEDAPNALDDNTSTNEDTPVCVNVLSNDVEVDGDILVVSSAFDGPKNGTVSIIGNQVCYSPNLNFNGKDTIKVIVCDNKFNGKCDTSSLFITVNPINDKPVAVDDGVITSEDVQSCTSVLLNDFDVDGDAIVITNITNPKNGTITILNGLFCYTPNANFQGLDTVRYIICENKINALCDTAIVAINVNSVNDPPIANNDNITTNEDIAACTNILTNDSDLDGDAIVISSITNPKSGTIFLNNGVLCYTPNPNFNGKDTITYILCENVNNGLCDTAKVFILVNSVEDSPIANDDIAITNEDKQICVNVLNNDNDVDGDPIVLSGTIGGPKHGTVSIVGNQVCYIPNSNYNGLDTVKVIVCDIKGKCDTSLLTITVLPINDAPLANNDNITTNEDTQVCVNVLVNDTDVDGPNLGVSNVFGTNNGIIFIQGNQVCYNPFLNFNGKDTITYVICDNGNPNLCDTAKIFVTVNPVNDKPIALDDIVNGEIGLPATFNILNNDSDPDGNPLNITIIDQPNNGTIEVVANGQTIYTPNTGFNGMDTFVYQICDPAGLCDTANVYVQYLDLIDVIIARDECVSTPEDQNITINVLANDLVDPTKTIVMTITCLPKNGQATVINNQIFYQPTNNFNGADSLCYRICFSGANPKCAEAKVCITVTPTPDTPIANSDLTTTDTITPLKIDVQANDIDIDGQGIVTTSIVDLPNHGSAVVVNGDSILYTPESGFVGFDTLIYQLCKFGFPNFCDTALVVIVVGNPNNPPVANIDTIITVINKEETVSVLVNDFDPDGDIITLSNFNNPKNGTLINQGNGVFVYNPRDGFSGVDSFTYVICDDGFISLCDTGIVRIEVRGIKVPNSISPNDDGSNDGLVITGLELYPDNYLKVFNRWGDIVFESKNYQNNWKGQLENAGLSFGERVPVGTYFYILYLDEVVPVLKGFIMVEY